MLNENFYKTIDNELTNLLDKYKDDKFLQKHKKNSNSQKSYALLIWFLDFYGKLTNYTSFITDGDKDSSCDIVFDKYDNSGNKVFYLVQSKWNNEDNSKKETDRDEILKTLSDFETILRGEKKNINDKLKEKLEDFYEHLKNNGDVKFIFLSLSQYKRGADENIKSLLNSQERTKFEVIDINRIKLDYIDRIYKKIEPINPLENYHNPEESQVSIEIERLDSKNGNFIKIEKPFDAYVFLLRPKILYDLFDKYGFALFHKNVRNPLLQSQFNNEIEKTAIDNPAYFWYYNNGITAITYLLPSIRPQALKIDLTGLQIINGAQTVYSIYKAYRNASTIKRNQMDNESLITLRLLKSGGKEFDLNVTRFTNSQNPVDDRDFCANDDIQIELQNNSYSTNVWYEKRRGEFRDKPENIKTVSNFVFANVYLAYHLQDPVSVLTNNIQQLLTKKDLIFISHKNNPNGLYEKIFNKDTTYEDMLCAFYIFDTFCQQDRIFFGDAFTTNIYHLLALSKIAFTKYLKAKFSESINVNKYIIELYEKNEKEIILKLFYYLNTFVDKHVGNEKEKINESPSKFLFTLSHYEKIKDILEDTEIFPEEIENIVLEINDITESENIE